MSADLRPVRHRKQVANRSIGGRGDSPLDSLLDSPSSSPARVLRRRRSSWLDRAFTVAAAVLVGTCAALVTTFYLVPDAFPRGGVQRGLAALGLQQRVHAVVIDAGSTGSRVLAFSFARGVLDRQLMLQDELWRQVKPGLSAYSDRPAEAAASIRGLLEEAKRKIPQGSWASTPVTLKATAGLRLLPKDKSEAILAEVEKELRRSGFAPEENLIEIMNPMEEGLFAWFTINFLLDKFDSSSHGDLRQSHASLDLGGGSTQITFAPSMFVSGLEGRKHFLHNVTVMHRTTEVYSHSYLGMGLMAARKAIFLAGNQEGVTNLRSACVQSKQPLSWDYQGLEYRISASDSSSFRQCFDTVQQVVEAEDIHVPLELKHKEIAAFSYFYDKAVERDLMPRQPEGVVRVGDFLEASKRLCDAADVDDSGFYCVDMTFIYTLLSRGYGLPDDKPIRLYKKIKGHEASWALGCAYKILEARTL